jgi:virginiamycin B lyase
MRIRATALLSTLAFCIAAAPEARAQEDTDPKLTEWQVPWDDTRPRDPYVAPDGKVWFVGQTGHYAGILDPATGEYSRVDLPEGAGPHNLVVAADGTPWYTGNRVGNIGRIDPETREVTTFPMPDERARDPHTLILDSDGDMWFTVQGGNFVGKFWNESGQVRLVEAPQVPGRGGRMGSSRPYGIVVDSNDRPWIALFNTNKLATVDPETFEMTTFDLPREGARPRRIGITSDDVLWYVDYAEGYLGRFDPATQAFQEWPMPSGSGARPYGMAVDDDDRIWFVETGVQPNKFVGFDPATGAFFSSVPVESGGGTIRHMVFDQKTNTIWFGADTGTVGRAVLPPRKRTVSE